MDLRPGCPRQTKWQRALLQRIHTSSQGSHPVEIDGTCGCSHLPPHGL